MKTFIRLMKWGVCGLIVVSASVVAYGYYSVVSFDIETLPANHGQVQSRLFLGDGDQQRLIVALGGSEGANAWVSDYWAHQRLRFHELGYAVLAVGYFGMQGTPAKLDRISLDAIHEAGLNAAAHPQVADGCFAVIGGSRGGEGALLLGSYFPDVAAVVAIVPGSSVFPALTNAMTTPGFSLGDQALAFVPVPWGATPELLAGDLRGAFEDMMRNTQAMADAAIAVEEINGPVLLVSATRDEMWPSAEMSATMMDRLHASDFPHHAEHIVIEGGHSAPLEHFDRVEAFLSEHYPGGAQADCLD